LVLASERIDLEEIKEVRKDMRTINLPIEFNMEAPDFPHGLRQEIKQSLLELAQDHQDMTGASVTLSQPAHGVTPYLFRASIVVYMRPENVYADEKSDSPEAAVSGAMRAIERQVREKREKRGESWKRHDLDSSQNLPPVLEEGE
jgi:ribosome-associated translation inhibitor RaiA